jgi:hypothetical protein
MFNCAALLMSVTLFGGQAEEPFGPAHEHLRGMRWWVGTWKIEGELPDGTQYTGELTQRWILNRNFIREFIKVERDGELIVNSQATIGWDPIQERITGWEFWRDGYHGQFSLSPDGTDVKGSGVLADGSKISFTGKVNLGPDKNSYTYEATITQHDTGTVQKFTQRATRKPEA